MRVSVSGVILLYLFICVTLLVFNTLTLSRAKKYADRAQARSRTWASRLEEEWERVRSGGVVSPQHMHLLRRKLRRAEQLIAYHNAIEPQLEAPGVQAYLDMCAAVFRDLAQYYARRPAMERAFFAYVISLYHPARDGRYTSQLVGALASFLENSTIYCRENVLKALCAMGSAGAIEGALELFHERGWVHPTRLLSDGLAQFHGDREALAWRLWRSSWRWEESCQVAVVQLATQISDAFCEEFARVLTTHAARQEVCFAIIRYFRRHRYEPIRPFLHRCMEGDNEMAIIAASALESYPGPDTTEALWRGLHSRNWYVRHNAAAALLHLGLAGGEMERLRQGGDRYALEMLSYVIDAAKAKAGEVPA